MPSVKSLITDIEHLSKTRNTYSNELSFAGRGLKFNTRQDAQELKQAILNTNNLKVLRLEGNTISPEAAEELAEAIEKQKLERFIGNDIFTGRLKDEIPLALRSICGAIDKSGANLVEVNMSDNAFGPIGLEALMNFFQSTCCYSLKEFRLHNNGLGPDGAKKLALSLEQGYKNSGGKLTLRVFVCGRNRLEYEGARTISNVLKMMGSLEEIQMPQNGIRPNGIEFIAEACASNPNLRTINFNDNTFRPSGGELMAKALSGLNNLEYINFGDCLLRSKGALAIARSLAHAQNIKEIILSFNEIALDQGLEIAKVLSRKKTLQLLDLNGNKFGEEGKLDLIKLLEPIQSALCTMSEDEGSDDEGEEDEDNAENDDDEEENSEVVVDNEDNDEYDELDDYEDYDEEEEDGEEGEYDDDNEDDEENDENHQQEKFGSYNIAPQSTLFKPFSQNNSFQMAQPHLNLNKLNLNNSKSNGPNLFTSMISSSFLKTNSIPLFDNFVTSPTLENLKKIDQDSFKKLIQLEKFNSKYLNFLISHLSKLYDESMDPANPVLTSANFFTSAFFSNPSNIESYADDFLTQFGFLKSEEKNFHPVELNDKLISILGKLFNEVYFPVIVKDTVLNYLKIRSTITNVNENLKKNTKMMIKALTC